jgi:hypothetical protein
MRLPGPPCTQTGGVAFHGVSKHSLISIQFLYMGQPTTQNFDGIADRLLRRRRTKISVQVFTPETKASGVRMGPEANRRDSVFPVAKTLTFVPPTSIDKMFIKITSDLGGASLVMKAGPHGISFSPFSRCKAS